MTHRKSTLIVLAAVLTAALPAAAAGAVDADATTTLSQFFHQGGRMNETVVEKPAYDPTTVTFSWNHAAVTYRGEPLAEGVVVPAGDSIVLTLYRDASFDGEFTTDVVVSYRVDGEDHVLGTRTTDPVTVAGSRPVAGAPAETDARAAVPVVGAAVAAAALPVLDGARASCGNLAACADAVDLARRVVPGAFTFAASFYRVVLAPYADPALDAAFTGESERELQADWEVIAVPVAGDTAIPAGAVLQVTYRTTYPGHPVDALPQDRIQFTHLPRPDIVTYIDRADAPTRMDLAVR